MRQTITILLAVAALAGVAAQPAAADDPQAWVHNTSSGWGWVAQECFTPYREGVVGQYGAWGAYHDGCTATRRCGSSRGCTVDWGRGFLSRWEAAWYYAYQQTCNVRMRVFDRYGALKWYRDGSGSSTGSDAGRGFTCRADVTFPYSATAAVQYGDVVTVQANGVRSTHPGTARVTAQVHLTGM